MQGMLDRGVASRRGIMCAHREAPYVGQRHRHSLLESERAQEHCLLLPLYADMTEVDQKSVVVALKEVLRACLELRNSVGNRSLSSVLSPASSDSQLGRNGAE
jgi:hypothetical protein